MHLLDVLPFRDSQIMTLQLVFNLEYPLIRLTSYEIRTLLPLRITFLDIIQDQTRPASASTYCILFQ